MKNRIMTLLLALLLCAPCLALAEADKPVLLGDFEAADIYGERKDQTLVTDASLTFVNVWGTFCGPCIDEMPHLGALAEEYEGRIQFLGIVGDANIGYGVDDGVVELAKSIVDQSGATAYPHLIPSDAMNERLLFSITAVPTSFFMDSEGRQFGKAYVGSRSEEDWRAIFDEMLALMGDAQQVNENPA